jgi:hypothetical protein
MVRAGRKNPCRGEVSPGKRDIRPQAATYDSLIGSLGSRNSSRNLTPKVDPNHKDSRASNLDDLDSAFNHPHATGVS